MLSRLRTFWRSFVRNNIIADDPYDQPFSDADFAYLSSAWRELHPQSLDYLPRDVADGSGVTIHTTFNMTGAHQDHA
jgi:hypothetical protein